MIMSFIHVQSLFGKREHLPLMSATLFVYVCDAVDAFEAPKRPAPNTLAPKLHGPKLVRLNSEKNRVLSGATPICGTRLH